jgi:hypothetical protein
MRPASRSVSTKPTRIRVSTTAAKIALRTFSPPEAVDRAVRPQSLESGSRRRPSAVSLNGPYRQNAHGMSSESNSRMSRTMLITVPDPAGRFNHAW